MFIGNLVHKNLVEEKVELTSRGIFGRSTIAPFGFPRGEVLEDSYNEFKIDRNAADDTFNVYKTKETKKGQEESVFPFLAVNNDFQFSGKDSIFRKILLSGVPFEEYFLHQSIFKSLKFTKLSSIATGVDLFLGQGKFSRGSMSSLFLNFKPFNKNVVSENNELIELKFIDLIRIHNKKEEKNNALNINNLSKVKQEMKKSSPIVSVEKQKIIFKPSKIDRFKGNNVVGTVFSKLLGGKINYKDIKITSGKFKINGMVFSTRFVPSINTNNTSRGITEIGKIVIDGYSYYDYKKEKVKTGYSETFFPGFVVPYNFKGTYIGTLKISFNEALENIIINIKYNAKEKILDFYEGKVKIDYEFKKSKSFFYTHLIPANEFENMKDLKNWSLKRFLTRGPNDKKH